jgi:hypothetical protein
MKLAVIACLAIMGAAFDRMPVEYWQNLAHGVNSRSLFKPGVLPDWSAALNFGPHITSCSFARFSVPFDSMTTYGPSGVNPVDGSVVMGLNCIKNGVRLPFLWVVTETASELIQLSTYQCSAQLNEADVFEGYLTFLPDGGVIFGMCGSIYVLPLNSKTARNIGGFGYSPSILALINTEKPQMIVAGGSWDRWWEDWGAMAVNIDGMDSWTITLNNTVSITDTTIMFSPDGKTMYNGHFDRWAPQAAYGLQFWKTPFVAGSQPYATYSPCSATRPWTYSADAEGNVYSTLCGNDNIISKVDKHGNLVWKAGCTTDCYSQRQQVFMTDDERYIYLGSTSATSQMGGYWVIDAKDGHIVHQFNVSGLLGANAYCGQVYGPFASRWPIPLYKKTRAVTQCTATQNSTTLYSFDPFMPASTKAYPVLNFWAPIVLTDSSDNIYAVGIDATGHPMVQRFAA